MRLTPPPGPMAGAVAELEAGDHGHLLVDNSVEPRIRMDTLVEERRKLPGRDTVAAVHDFEHLWRRLGRASAKNRFTFASMRPQAVMVWKKGGPSKENLCEMAEIIREHLNKFRA